MIRVNNVTIENRVIVRQVPAQQEELAFTSFEIDSNFGIIQLGSDQVGTNGFTFEFFPGGVDSPTYFDLGYNIDTGTGDRIDPEAPRVSPAYLFFGSGGDTITIFVGMKARGRASVSSWGSTVSSNVSASTITIVNSPVIDPVDSTEAIFEIDIGFDGQDTITFSADDLTLQLIIQSDLTAFG